MAFFTLEDRYAEIECLAFPQVYRRFADDIKPDAAVAVVGTVSYRENEGPKILVDRIEPLIENEAYVDAPAHSDKREENTESVQETHVAKDYGRISEPNVARPAAGKRLFLRVPDAQGLLYRKAVNLIEILEGSCPVVLYDEQKKTYMSYRGGVALTDYAYDEFVRLLGKENVIFQ